MDFSTLVPVKGGSNNGGEQKFRRGAGANRGSHGKADSESAEGWYVLLTKKGSEELKKLGANITIVRDIKRDWYYERPRSRQTRIEIPTTM